MSRRKIKLPGRYERPAFMRPALGDRMGELQVRAAHRVGNQRRIAEHQAARVAAFHAGGKTTDEVTLADLTHMSVALDPYLATVESAPVLDRPAELHIRESVATAITEHPGEGPSGRLITVDVIRSGWNSSGSRYYPADVLERDVPNVYPKGCQVFIDHPRITEQEDIPERSLTTLAGKFETTPWAVHEADGSVTMRTTVKVFSPWQPLIREAWDTIGLSINGGGRGDYGERDGREGTIIEALTHGRSVDFVTVPGAGGRVVALMESHRPFESPEFRAALDQVTTREAASLGAYVESRIHLGFTELGDDLYAGGHLTRSERITLSGAIGDALAMFVARVERDAPQLYQRGRYADPDTATETVTTEAAERRVREATAEQSRLALDQAVFKAYGAEPHHTWVQEYDPARGVVWFAVRGSDDRSVTWQQSYVTSQGTAVLVGDRVEVRARVIYEPVTSGAVDGPPAITATTETGRREVPVRVRADVSDYTGPARTVEAATHQTTAGGSPSADSDGHHLPASTKEGFMPDTKSPEVVAREAAETRLTAAELELARYRATDSAMPIVNQLLAESGMTEPEKNKIRMEYPAAALPLRESDRGLDDGALRTRVAASIAAEKAYIGAVLESHGVGTVRGAGPAAGAGGGIPAGYGMPQTGGAPAPAAGFFGMPATSGPVLTEQQTRESAAAREQLIGIWVGRGMTREAAELAVDADN